MNGYFTDTLTDILLSILFPNRFNICSGNIDELLQDDRNRLLEEQRKNNEYHRFGI